MSLKRPSILALLLVIAGALTAHAGVRITIVNANAPGIGFNDPAPVAPIGGNSATSVGAQRLITFQRAAEIWGGLLDSNIEVKIRATFEPLACAESSGTLGSAGTRFVFSDFENVPRAGIWYHAALASKLANSDLTIDSGSPNGEEVITARFNSELGQPGCLAASGWYYGLDAQAPSNRIDLIAVLLHEFAHGLGFSTLVNKGTGALFLNRHDIYSVFVFDNKTGLNWTQLTNEQRQASIISNDVVWEGQNVTREAPAFLAPSPFPLRVNSPASVAADYPIGTAGFGPPISATPLTAALVQAIDTTTAESASTTDGCTAFTNASAISGKIAFIDRGNCPFVIKVKNAQNAGALAVVVADHLPPDNSNPSPDGLGGSDRTITIPSVRIFKTDGDKLRPVLGGGVSVTFRADATKLAGADTNRRVKLFAPDPVVGGSSISHWDVSATPNLLMEPNINSDLTHGVDLTLPLFADLGWLALAAPPPAVSSFTATPSFITRGNSSTLSWTTTNVTSVTIDNGVGSQPVNGSVSVSPTANTTYTLTATGPGGTATGTVTLTVTAIRGDANGDGTITAGDVFYLINHLFASGPGPVGSGDANGDGAVTAGDAFYLINFLFSGGPPPG